MFYKKQKMKDKWFPRSITVGTYDTDDVANELSLRSTVSRGDTYAVLVGLGDVLGKMMATGKSVRLKGLGTFMLTGVSSGRGVDTPEEVNGDQFHDVRIRFIPEYERNQFNKVINRTIAPKEKMEWIEWNGVK